MYDIVRQDGPSCWTACLSMLTGIDYDVLPHDALRQIAVFPTHGDQWTTKRPFRFRRDKQPTLDDWNKALRGGFELKASYDFYGECIAAVEWHAYGDEFAVGHAVVIDDDGIVIDPDHTLDGVTQAELENGCNIKPLVYIYVKEV